MTSIIDQLIEERDDEIRLAKEAKEKKSREASEALLVSMREYLGSFWNVLEERAVRTGERYICNWETNNEDIPIRILYHIPALPELEIAPMVIKWGENSLRGSHYYDAQQRFTVGGHYYSDLKDALRAAREEYPKYVEQAREEAIDKFRKDMTAAKTEEQALAIAAKHKEEYPDRSGEAEATLNSWGEREARRAGQKEAERREQEERAADAQLQRTLKIGYILDLAKYLKDYEETLAKNKETAEKIQADSDEALYTAYELTYAYMARYEEDGETYREIETRSVWTLYAIPDSFGFWDIDGKKIEIYNPVSLEINVLKPSSGILAKSVERGEVTLYFHPEKSDEIIEEIAAAILPLPQTPEWPKGLYRTYGDERDLRLRAAHYNETGEIDLDSYMDSSF